ncbi:Na+/H+ antiporter NhaA [Streptomyces sp. NPDC051740]|uniref:Na+/H+ antiporter NhaA n=1 Tax=Streptomyces sp. NPDC051740 TaxID=3365673 RepID=UPI003797290D
MERPGGRRRAGSWSPSENRGRTSHSPAYRGRQNRKISSLHGTPRPTTAGAPPVAEVLAVTASPAAATWVDGCSLRGDAGRLCRRTAAGQCRKPPRGSEGEPRQNAPGEHAEYRPRPVSAGFAVPLSALFAAGVSISPLVPGEAFTRPEPPGVLLGLVVGKTVGISTETHPAARFTRVRLNPGLTWADVFAFAVPSGIGFTVALLVTEVSFPDPAAAGQVKAAVPLGSVLAAGMASLLVERRDRIYRGPWETENRDEDTDGIPDICRQHTDRPAPGAPGEHRSPTAPPLTHRVLRPGTTAHGLAPTPGTSRAEPGPSPMSDREALCRRIRTAPSSEHDDRVRTRHPSASRRRARTVPFSTDEHGQQRYHRALTPIAAPQACAGQQR